MYVPCSLTRACVAAGSKYDGNGNRSEVFEVMNRGALSMVANALLSTSTPAVRLHSLHSLPSLDPGTTKIIHLVRHAEGTKVR